jgi:hypothetical protein
VYYSYIIVFFGKGGGVQGSEMAVARSTDNGQTWTPTYFNFQSGGAQFNDKPMITVDNNPGSPHEGTVYVGWDNATGGNGSSSSSNFILVSHSTDHGVTFSAPVPASDTSAGPKGGIGADPFVAPDGTVHVAWLDYRNGGINESSSNDGGLSFGPVHLISATNLTFDIAIPAENVRGALVYPSCAADRSAGAYRGTLYCIWMDLTASNGADIFLSRSTDGGATWQRCQTHLSATITDATPKALLDEVHSRVRTIFEAPDVQTARVLLAKFSADDQHRAPTAVATLECGFADATAILALPASYRQRLRTTNAVEVVDEVTQHFPKERFQSMVPNNMRLSEAPMYGLTILEHEARSPGALAYKALAEEVIERANSMEAAHV